jgi:hypothetical protein
MIPVVIGSLLLTAPQTAALPLTLYLMAQTQQLLRRRQFPVTEYL